MDLAPGMLLIAEPSMLDPNFKRAVILLCDHNADGSFGLVLNKPTELHLPEVLMEPVGLEHRLFLGGPVQPDTLHFLHGYAHEIETSVPVLGDVGWGGPFEEIAEQIRSGTLDAQRFRFFAGYTGWGGGQLEEEIEEESWIVQPATAALIFASTPERLWRDLIVRLGDQYALLVNYPDDPRSN